MKKQALLITILGFALIINGCGKKEETSSNEQQATPAKQTAEQAAKVTKAVAKTTEDTLKKQFVSMGIAPDFELPKLDGTPVKLSDMKGKIVILDFWATWCPPCRQMIPELKKIHNEYKNKGVEILAVSLDEGGTQAVQSFVESANIDYPVLLGSREVSKKFGQVNAIPTSFIIDREGNIRDKHIGYRDAEDMEAIIKSLIAR